MGIMGSTKARTAALVAGAVLAGAVITAVAITLTRPASHPAGTPVAVASAAPARKAIVTETPTAAQVAAKFTGAGIPVRDLIVYTAATDPNRLIGHPGGYLSKVAWVDGRIPAGQLDAGDTGGTENGGSVEVFPSAAQASARATTLEGFSNDSPALFGEYDFTHGPVVLRVSRYLSPEQAADYNRALNDL